MDGYGDMLPGIEVGLEFIVEFVDQVVDPRYCLELDASQDRAFEGFGEGLFDFLGASKLDKRSARCSPRTRRVNLTSDSRASKKLSPEWPVIWHINLFCTRKLSISVVQVAPERVVTYLLVEVEPRRRIS